MLEVVAAVTATLLIASPDELSIPIQVSSVWTPVAAADPAPGGPAPIVAGALRRTRIAIMPDGSRPSLPEAADMRRALRLEETDSIVGEPMLVELRVEVHGDGTHGEAIGGNYRARGRDDNFLVLMRHEDGTWASDPYGRIWGYMGGLGTTITVTADEPSSQWTGVSRRCIVDRPGTWDVFLFHRTNDYDAVGSHDALVASLPERYGGFEINDRYEIVDPATGEPTGDRVAPSWQVDHEIESPLVAAVPDAVREQAGAWMLSECTTYAHYRVNVRQGTAAERAEMVQRWTDVARSGGSPRMPADRADAAVEAIRFTRGADFLPLMREWLGASDEYDTGYGLAMNPHPAAFELLLELGPDAAVFMYSLDESHREHAIPLLREWIETGVAGEQAERLLEQWGR